MRIRLLPLPGGRFALIVDRIDTEMHLDPETFLEGVGFFADKIGASGCLISAEDVEMLDPEASQ